MPQQISKKFDKETMSKVLKSLGLTVVSAIGVIIVALTQGVELQSAILVGLGTLGAFLVNTANEYNKGEKIVAPTQFSN